MNSSHYSRLAVAIAVMLVLGAAAPAMAVSVSEHDVSGDAEVGTQTIATFTLDELYKDPSFSSWTLEGETDLENVTWTITFYDQTGEKVDQFERDGGNFSDVVIDSEEGVDEVLVRVEGDVPGIEEYSYEDPEEFTVATLTQSREGGTSNEIGTWSAHHYTTDTRDARTAIENAEAAIAETNEAGADTDEAEDSLQSAIEAYNGGNFGLAGDLADEAAEEAEDAKQSSEQRQTLLYGGLVIVALVLLGGGGYVLYQRQQDDYDKLG